MSSNELRDKMGTPIAKISAGIVGQISWRRLFDEAFRSSGEIKPDEEVVAFIDTGNTVVYYVDKRSRP